MAKDAARYVAPFEGLYDADGVQVSSGQDNRGRELPDPVPLSPPVGYKAPATLADMIQRMVKSELMRAAAEAEDFDSFEEAEDFDVPDDPLDPHTPYEAVFDPPPSNGSAPPTGNVGSNGVSSHVSSSDNGSPVNSGPNGAHDSAGAAKADPVGNTPPVEGGTVPST